jgi:hypothetical protein
MKPAIVFPYTDPDGSMLPHLRAIIPDLQMHFERAYISTPPSTRELLKQNSEILTDGFFTVFVVDAEKDAGEHFTELYQRTANAAPADQLLHLGFIDRLTFALETEYRSTYLADVDKLTLADVPLVFQRSAFAWDTHPQSYRELEALVTTVGKNLFGRELDYAWCYLVLPAERLRKIALLVEHPGISMVAEIVYYVQEEVKTREVDWLAWEDPFIFGREDDELKQERENNLAETKKRLNYVVPMIDMLTKHSKNGRK